MMAGLLVAGFFCNAAVRPVDPRHHMPPGELGAEAAALQKKAA
jgi:hypothetical protein